MYICQDELYVRIIIVNIQRSVDKVLEASLGQGSESWSRYLSFEDL